MDRGKRLLIHPELVTGREQVSRQESGTASGTGAENRTAGRARAVEAATTTTTTVTATRRVRAGPSAPTVVAFPGRRATTGWSRPVAAVVRTMVCGGDTAVPAGRSPCVPGGQDGRHCYRGPVTVTAVVYPGCC